MKKNIFILFTVFCMFSCSENAKDNQTQTIESNIIQDADFQELIELEYAIELDVLNGVSSRYRKYTLEKLKSNLSYCDILENESNLDVALINNLNAKCSRSRVLTKLHSKYLDFYNLPLDQRLKIKENYKSKMELEIKPEKAHQLLNFPRTTFNS